MTLRDLQRALIDHLLTGDRRIAERVRRQEGLEVYHHAYRAQLTACLRDTYERVWAWLGDDAFDRAAACHVELRAPRSWTLNDYGEDFAATLASLYPDDPEVPELAWLDWALRRAFDGPDSTPLDIETLNRVDEWDDVEFRFAPTVRLGVVVTNSPAIWSALAEDRTPPPLAQLAAAADVLVWRPDLSPRFRTMNRAEAHVLKLALAGATFGDICLACVLEVGEQATVEDIGSILVRWLRDGFVIGFEAG
jgi:hypothetical protein